MSSNGLMRLVASALSAPLRLTPKGSEAIGRWSMKVAYGDRGAHRKFDSIFPDPEGVAENLYQLI